MVGVDVLRRWAMATRMAAVAAAIALQIRTEPPTRDANGCVCSRILLRLLGKLLHMGAVNESRLVHPSDIGDIAVGNRIRVDGGDLRQVGSELVESNPVRNHLRQHVTGNLWSTHRKNNIWTVIMVAWPIA